MPRRNATENSQAIHYDYDHRQSPFECGVCMDNPQAGQRVVELKPCKHSFQRDCFSSYTKERGGGSCSLCRAPVDGSQLENPAFPLTAGELRELAKEEEPWQLQELIRDHLLEQNHPEPIGPEAEQRIREEVWHRRIRGLDANQNSLPATSVFDSEDDKPNSSNTINTSPQSHPNDLILLRGQISDHRQNFLSLKAIYF
ncbi:hypothetical protein EJ08DRAFT_738103 [Tothia fuscella]|uniref:RING-type domain-containing protein n=1 Tax=Tothia fuscella TaxID=1048955 RepID=A0A9P4TUD7_9PEZI|nr:hypothetical protein EJ08DRAFT_738103 [Tothia fuscella]